MCTEQQPKNIGQTLKQDKAYTLQHSYSKAQVKLEPKFGQFYTQDKAYTLQHSYSKAQVKLEPKFVHIIH